MDIFLQALGGVLHPLTLGLIFIGVAVGIVFGSIPGLSAAMAVALFLPMTFTMGPDAGMALLVALYIGGVSGGLISAILLNIPGTPSSIATCFDGAPMARKGQAAKAIGIGIVVSFIGGLASFIALIYIAPPLAQVALRFSPIEYFSISVFALTLIGALSSGSLTKGLLSGMLGLMAATVGVSPIDGSRRFLMGMEDLSSGFNLLAVLIGLFAVTEMLLAAEDFHKTSVAQVMKMDKIRGFGFSMAELLSQKWNMLRSSVIGMLIGILPGIGGSTSGILSYVAAKKQSRYPEKFGTGIIDGVVASEAANNATIGGALIPLLVLGIPGDGVTAILLGAFLVHGLTPGPLLFKTNADFVYGIFAACIVANCVMLALEFFGLRIYIRLLRIPKYLLLSIIMVLCIVGGFAVNNRMFDAQTILVFGFIGYLMKKGGIPLVPAILGFILGPLIETNLRRGLMLTDGSFLVFFERPISLFFLAAAILSVAVPVARTLSRRRRIPGGADAVSSSSEETTP